MLRPIATVLHAHSTWSSGALSLEDLIAQARGRNVEAVFLAENHLQRFEYGLPPLRTLLRHRVEYPSVLPKGPDAFLRAVQAANEKQRDVLIIPGVETIPHYFWTGNLLGGTLTMHNAQKNVLALGLYRAEDYQALPVVGNDGSARWGLGSLWLLSPVLLIIGGVWLLRVKRRRVIRLRHFRVAEERRLIGPGVLCLVAGILLLANNYPFRPPGVSPYDDAAGLTPHQNVIDFVAARGGISVWSLPEARDHQVVTVAGLRATIRTDPYPEDLLRTDRFAAFGGIYEDTTTFTEPGQGWDQLLLEYLHGRRAAPAWAVGEAAFHFEGQAGKRFGDVQTVILAARKDAAAILESLRADAPMRCCGPPRRGWRSTDSRRSPRTPHRRRRAASSCSGRAPAPKSMPSSARPAGNGSQSRCASSGPARWSRRSAATRRLRCAGPTPRCRWVRRAFSAWTSGRRAAIDS